MNKRAIEDKPEGQPPSKQAANQGGGAAIGAQAETVNNPIPRLFRQNSITIHITQRTFEEISPGELKYCPTDQYWAAMFDKFHYNQFKQYFDQCVTYELSSPPKVRISNLLMLQDDQTTMSGTPKDNSVFTQACYMMTYHPKGMRQWFKLGQSSDCMTSQKYLKYKPMQYNECNMISQMIKIGENDYTDFEKLVINPAQTNLYAGWGEEDVTVNKTNPIGTNCNVNTQATGSHLIKDIPKSDLDPRYVENVYISPRGQLRNFSCSVSGCEPHIPMGKHTTYCRNLDKISLHKYGDVIEWTTTTNLEGVKLLKHKHNNPFWGVTNIKKAPNKTDELAIKWAFCYPSENRPFYCRKDNFDITGTIEANRNFKPLSHHFFTMPPIKKGDGSLIKQRCSFTMEQSCVVTFHFPETIAEENYEHTLSQRDAVILRPAIIKIEGVKTEKSPKVKPPPPTNTLVDGIRYWLRSRIVYDNQAPAPHKDANGLLTGVYETVGNVLANNVAQYSVIVDQIIRDVLACFAVTYPPKGAYLLDLLKKRNIPTEIQWDKLIASPPKEPYDPEHAIDPTAHDALLIPPPNHQLKFNMKPLNEKELKEMLNPSKAIILWGYLFGQFLLFLRHNNLLGEIGPGSVIKRLKRYEHYQNQSGIYINEMIGKDMVEEGDHIVDALWQQQCAETTVSFILPADKRMEIIGWTRRKNNYTEYAHIHLQSYAGLDSGPVVFRMSYWYYFLYYMRIPILPRQGIFIDFLQKWNNENLQVIESVLPDIVVTNPDHIELGKKYNLLVPLPQQPEPEPELLEPILPQDVSFNDYETDMFFV